MRKLLPTVFLMFFIGTGGCSNSRTENYALQEKCAKAAKELSEKERYGYANFTYYYPKSSEAYLKSLKESGKLHTIGDVEAVKDKVEEISYWFDYQNHYNSKMNRCFVHVWAVISDPRKEFKYSMLGEAREYLIDVNEHQKYGAVEIVTSVVLDAKSSCYLLEKTCNSVTEWRALIRPYMEK